MLGNPPEAVPSNRLLRLLFLRCGCSLLVPNRVLLLRTLSGLLLAASAVVQAADRHFLWQVEGPESTVHLLGSIHALRPDDYPLATPIRAAFRDADAVVLEARLPAGGDGGAMPGQEPGKGEGLAEQLSEQQYHRAQELARRHDIDLDRLSGLEPWLAAMVITQGAMQRAGYRPGHGLDRHIQRRAEEADKPILTLETPREQLRLLDNLPPELQGAFLLKALQELDDLGTRLDELVRAWKVGRADEVKRLAVAEVADYPQLYERLMVRRNRDWLVRIEDFAEDGRDYLVVVGAGHLVGEEGLVALLRERGHTVTQK